MKPIPLDRPFRLPHDHQPGMRVPKPGSSCANCRFASITPDGPRCVNTHYQAWAGTSALIDPKTGQRVLDAQQYCSDWYEPARG